MRDLGKLTLVAILGILTLAVVAHPFGCTLYIFHGMTCR